MVPKWTPFVSTKRILGSNPLERTCYLLHFAILDMIKVAKSQKNEKKKNEKDLLHTTKLCQNNLNETATQPSIRQPIPMGTVTTTEKERVCLTPIFISRSLSQLIRKLLG